MKKLLPKNRPPWQKIFAQGNYSGAGPLRPEKPASHLNITPIPPTRAR
jgi:hypothetical protein